MIKQTSDEQLEAWRGAVAASEKHLKIAAQLQRDGLEALQMLRAEKGADKTKLREARAMLALGVTMEKDAHTHLLMLYRTKPRATK
jgi:hypothetical protein